MTVTVYERYRYNFPISNLEPPYFCRFLFSFCLRLGPVSCYTHIAMPEYIRAQVCFAASIFNRFFALSVPMAKPEIREQVELPNRLFCCRGRLNCCVDRECDISVRGTNADLNFIILVQNHLGQLPYNDQDLQLLRNPSLYDLNSNM